MKKFFALSLFLSLSACTTVTSPVLRHETGESLGGFGKVRANVRIERSRLYPAFGPNSAAVGVAQKEDAFKGTLAGINASVGMHQKFDLQGGWAFSQGGGGWRIGGKYQWRGALSSRNKGLAVSGMAGYARYSGNGDLTYLTNSYNLELLQTLALETLDFSVPASWRFSPNLAAYGGILYFHSLLSGSSGPDAVSYVSNDFGLNLGVRVNVKWLEFDLEGAVLRVYDPFVDGFRLVPFYGISAGVSF